MLFALPEEREAFSQSTVDQVVLHEARGDFDGIRAESKVRHGLRQIFKGIIHMSCYRGDLLDLRL